MSLSKVITRFAPSPTGALHVGGARTALFNWAYARQHGGAFILRIEDTDRKRSTAASTLGIIRDLRWLGLDWDQGPACPKQPGASFDPYDPATQLGDRGPYFQSQRLDIYNQAIDKLLRAGKAVEEDGPAGKAVRFQMPRADLAIEDEILGTVNVAAGQVEDFIIRKSDGFPTYHLAVVVDDALMGVTHVIRGQEHLNNAFKHIALQQALGYDRPTYAHIPLIFNPDGSKMSKRDKAKAARKAAENAGLRVRDIDETRYQAFLQKESDDLDIAVVIAEQLNMVLPEIDVDDFRRSGYLPEVLVNYLALLGWNPGNDLERFDSSLLVQQFSFQRCGRSASKFDREKLLAFNYDTIRQMPADDFADRLRTYMLTHQPEAVTRLGERFTLFANCYQPRTHMLAEPVQLGAFLIMADDQMVYNADDKQVNKAMLKNDGEGVKTLRAFRDVLADLPVEGFGSAAHDAMKDYCEQQGIGMGKVAQPLRVAVSGGVVTPEIDKTLDILGKDATLARVDRCLAAFEKLVADMD